MKIGGHTFVIREKNFFGEFLWGLLDAHVGMENIV